MNHKDKLTGPYLSRFDVRLASGGNKEPLFLTAADVQLFMLRQPAAPTGETVPGGKADLATEAAATEMPMDAFRQVVGRAFTSDGTLNGRRLYGNTFLSGETDYVGVQLYFNAAKEARTAFVSWQIFTAEGASFSEPQRSEIQVAPGVGSVFVSWSPGEKGWPVGRYRISADLNGNAVSQSIEIIPGKYDDCRFTLTELRFFEGGSAAPDEKHRVYLTQFSALQTRRIYYQLNFTKLIRNARVPLHCRILDQNGADYVNYSTLMHFTYGTTSCVAGGYGSDGSGTWKKGKYTVVVSVGRNSNIVSGEFQVV